jgi:hypothetical protein
VPGFKKPLFIDLEITDKTRGFILQHLAVTK